MLQCRVGKRTGTAALNMAMDMIGERLINEAEAVMRITPAQLDEMLHPIVDPQAETAAVLAKGLPAGPGAPAARSSSPPPPPCGRQGRQAWSSWCARTNPEDVEGMRAAEGILTARGG